MIDNEVIFRNDVGKIVEYTPIITCNQSNDVVFFSYNQKETIRFKFNGDIFIHGKLVENDQEVVSAMRKFLGLEKKGL